MRRLLERTLRSKVALRMAILFVACAVIPLVGLALITVNQMTDKLRKQALGQLHYDVKSAAMGALERLSLIEATLRVAGAAVAEAPEGTIPPAVAHLAQTLGAATPVLAYFPDHGSPRVVRGRLNRPELNQDQARHLANTGRLIVTVASAGGSQQILLVRVDTSGGGTAAAALNHRALFALDEDQLPPFSDLCVVQDRLAASCSVGAPDDVVRQVRVAPTGRDVTPTVDGPFFVATWTIPLRGSYATEAWTTMMMRPESAVLGPVRPFVRDFWLVLVLSVLVVTLVALSQVRRQLLPVASLAEATRRLAQRNFDEPVRVHSGDEFQELGQSFNMLAVELKRQFSDLEAFNLGTLAALARAIDAKSPWTAGHSERVTRLAVALAKEVGLSADEIEDLRRGGLIHDIGKLGTPAGILDKVGSLTDAELRIMQAHTRQGVHILEPIPGYARLLPIVGQHHERWDGSGYPDGLKGEAIARTARVLAVADVCDALRSDRPYRKSMAWSELVQFVRERSGTQFDPSVVDALLRLPPPA
jgi:putative nucleotidyltransferase with HDIG domain